MKPECDLILLTWNHLETTKKCLQSLFQYTDLPSRLVIVDNGSDQPGAREYLGSVRPSGKITEVVFIRNAQDFGVPKGINVGLRFCLSQRPASYICFMNNDIVAMEGWLSELVQIAASHSVIGLVNPTSTNFGFYPPREDPQAISQYAIKVTQNFKGKWLELSSCVGFCLLAKKELLDKIGLFDETFGMAYYEDTDLSKRAQAAGYLCALAQGSYVYHQQGESFGRHQQENSLFLKNEETFYSRWKMTKPTRVSYILTGRYQSGVDKIPEKIRESANQFNKIWVLYKDKETGKSRNGFPRHWNVQRIPFRGPAFLFYLWSLFFLYAKKKRFDRILIDDARLLRFLKQFQVRYKTQFELL